MNLWGPNGLVTLLLVIVLGFLLINFVKFIGRKVDSKTNAMKSNSLGTKLLFGVAVIIVILLFLFYASYVPIF